MNEKLDSKTLADVKPGGRVRLGDALPPLPAPNYPVSKTGLQNNAYTASQMTDYARAALYARQPVGYVLVPVEPTEAMIDAGARALPQPVARVSAYGEGSWDERRPWSENNDKARAVLAAMLSACPEVPAAIAACQPVGEPMRSDLSGYAVAASQVRRGYDVECDRCGKFCDEGPGPCQPAQAVDLDKLRALADRWATDRSYSGSPADDLRAWIDSQA